MMREICTVSRCTVKNTRESIESIGSYGRAGGGRNGIAAIHDGIEGSSAG